MIGIAAIIVTFSIGRGAELKIRSQILAMGEGAAYIIPGNVVERGAARSSLSRQARLTEGDLEAIEHQIKNVIRITRGHENFVDIQYGPITIRERIVGTDPNLLDISNYTLAQGVFFNDFQEKAHTNVVVLGHELAKKLFKKEYPINQTITLEKVPFTVIGVFKPIDFFWGTNDPNTRAYIPFTVADKYFRKSELNIGDLTFIALKVEDDYPGQTIRMTRRILRQRHSIDEGEPDDFMIFDQESIASAAQEASRMIKLFGLIAASISLLVGGIGVMNIMLVSVKERTREIGVRLAIGATQALVRSQFLIEAVTLCSFGGILGIVLGIIAQHIISKGIALPTVLEPYPLFLAFLVTIMVGIFFGYYPARKASLLNPVDALLER
jgi:putative ABC transport system permease protein